MNDSENEQKYTLLDRKITLRWTLILIAIAIIAGLILLVFQASERNRITFSLESKLEKSLSYSAINTAKAIAIFGNRQINAQNWQLLQDYADNLVKNEPLTYIAIVDVKNRAKVHTNRRFIGKELPPPSDSSDVIEVSVPVMDYTKQVAAVRVGVKYLSE